MVSPPSIPAPPAAVFVDRDGTLNEDPGYVHRPEDLVLRPGVLEGLKLLAGRSLPLIVVTNQGGIGLGRYTEDEMREFNAALERTVRPHGIGFTGFYWCPHHPHATRPELRGPCACRKPEPGLLLRAAAERGLDLAASWMLGDQERDVEAGQRAGCRTVLIGGTTHTRADFVASDFLAAARVVDKAHLGEMSAREEELS